MAGECDLIVDLHFVEEPFRIALQDFRQVDANISGWLAESVHDAAEGSFVNAQHPSQTVLSNASGVHAKFQIRVDVSIQVHGSRSHVVRV